MIRIYLRENRELIKTLDKIRADECFASINDVGPYLIKKGIMHTLAREKIRESNIPVDIKDQLWKIEDEVTEMTEKIKVIPLSEVEVEHEYELAQ